MTCPPSLLDDVAALLRRAPRTLFITGAGISADSGLPTYRGIGGLYDARLTEEGIPIEVALSGPMFEARPEITWKYLHQIEQRLREARPNLAHRVIAEAERRLPLALTLTQNIDGLHARAGAANIIEIHGNLHRLRCTDCRFRRTVDTFVGLGDLPACPRCAGLLRPDVVLFEEALPADAIDRLEAVLEDGVGLVFSIGTSSRFPYIAAPVAWAHDAGVPVVEINPEDTPITRLASHPVRCGAAEAMGELARRVGWSAD